MRQTFAQFLKESEEFNTETAEMNKNWLNNVGFFDKRPDKSVKNIFKPGTS